MRTPVTAVELAKFTLQTDFNIQGPGKEMYEASKVMAKALVEANSLLTHLREGRSLSIDNHAAIRSWINTHKGSEL